MSNGLNEYARHYQKVETTLPETLQTAARLEISNGPVYLTRVACQPSKGQTGHGQNQAQPRRVGAVPSCPSRVWAGLGDHMPIDKSLEPAQ